MVLEKDPQIALFTIHASHKNQSSMAKFTGKD